MIIWMGSNIEKILNKVPDKMKDGKTVIKPNFVMHGRNMGAKCTSSSLMKEIIKRIGPKNSLIVTGSHRDCKLKRVLTRDGFDEFIKKNSVDLIDIREEYVFTINGVPIFNKKLEGDKAGEVLFNLGSNSYFSEIEQSCRLIHGAKNDVDEILEHHTNGKHEYLLSGSVLKTENFLSVPKLKVHKKVGVTLNLKGLVGIITNKNYLPHFRYGSPQEGGDEFENEKKFESNIKRISRKTFLKLGPLGGILNLGGKILLTPFLGSSKRTIRAGNWHGNDTAWRMVLDLYKILVFGGLDGKIHEEPQRRTFSIIDGIVGGENNGPLDPTPKKSNILIAGDDLFWVDVVALTLMGFDYKKIPIYERGIRDNKVNYNNLKENDIRINDVDKNTTHTINELPNLCFSPHFGWKNYIER